MNIETLQEYAMSKKGVEETLPFGPQTLVYKVGGKMFLLIPMDESPLTFSVKCDPDQALEWREQFDAVQPAYHMNKKHWNMVAVDGSVPVKIIRSMIDDSYELVINSLPAVKRAAIKK